MSIHRWKWRIVAVVTVLFIAGAMMTFAFKNRLSNTTIVGHWQGYILQTNGTVNHEVVTKVPLDFTFRPDGLVTRNHNLTDAHYMVCDNALVFYNVRSRNVPSHPVLWNARLVGNTLTLSGNEPVAVLRRVQ